MMVGKYLLFSSLFLFINQFHRTHSVCSIDSNGNQRVGSRCEYACHCKSTKEMCDDVTGHCVSGCATGWTGPGCQYEDIAFNKYRRHIDNIPDKQMWADYANDGNVSSCSRTGDPRTQKNLRRSGKPWWWVQLDTAVNMKLIQGLVITTESGQESLFSGFKVYVEESRSELKNTYEKQQTCFSHNGTFLNTTMHVTCNKPLIGNRVRIELDSGNSQLVLCDVKVFEGRNLAYGRVAALSSEDDISANALFAVDGKVSTSACSKTKKELFPWWSVDLNKTFAIHSIRITKYNDATLSHYKLQTINAWSNAWTTLYDDGEMDTPTTYLVLSATVRHLRLYWEGSWKMFQVAVCEFQAFGDCPEHKCGLDCTTDCHCQDFSLADRFTETCTNGCENRWTGINGKCNIECAAGKWGPSCDNPCGYCINREQCEAQTGYCLNGCEDGYMTDEFCVLPCDDRNYGPGCTYNCSGHCKNGDLCQKSNGNCPYGCDIGWEGDLCDEMCQEGYYGDNCSSECGQCLHGTCDRIYGGCTGGCKDGYIYDMYCDKACVNATWGSNCSEQCGQCLDGPCDNIDGVCSQGCLPGYINTEYCNEQCRHGTYGHNCAEKCSVTCYHPSVCRPNDGQCELCMTGWKGYTCEQECEEHEWGEGCIYHCGGCHNDTCNKTTGTCFSGCLPGFKSSTMCNEECDNGAYGINCTHTCGNCEGGNGNCGKVTGICTYGCADGFVGPFCSTVSPGIDYTSIAAVVTGSCVACFVSAIMFLGFLFLRSKWRNKEKSEEDVLVGNVLVRRIDNEDTSADVWATTNETHGVMDTSVGIVEQQKIAGSAYNNNDLCCDDVEPSDIEPQDIELQQLGTEHSEYQESSTQPDSSSLATNITLNELDSQTDHKATEYV